MVVVVCVNHSPCLQCLLAKLAREEAPVQHWLRCNGSIQLLLAVQLSFRCSCGISCRGNWIAPDQSHVAACRCPSLTHTPGARAKGAELNNGCETHLSAVDLVVCFKEAVNEDEVVNSAGCCQGRGWYKFEEKVWGDAGSGKLLAPA